VALLYRRLRDTAIEIAISLITPFGAYLAGEHLGVSGVLATVAAGLCAGWWSPTLSGPETRLRSRAVWDMLAFLLNGLVFILIGLQLLRVLPALGARPLGVLVGVGLLLSVTVIVVRFAWIFGTGWLDRMLTRRPLTDRTGDRIVVSWAGMRGVVSLATALALPLDLPDRDLLIFLTFCVILVTLVGQGWSLSLIVRLARVSEGGGGFGLGVGESQERRARRVATEAALARLDALLDEWPTHAPLIDSLRAQYTRRITHLEEASPSLSADPGAEQEMVEHRKIRQSVLEAERSAVLQLRSGGSLDEQTWHRIQRDLDLEALRLDA
jgi:monovalent cation/hydrogen antiporter